MRPLDGVRVLDLTRVVSGPYCTMLLCDLGAEVIKIERLGVGDDTRAFGPPFQGGEAAYFLSINRNKKSVTLDLKQSGAIEVLWRLIDRSDVLVENGMIAEMAHPTAGIVKGVKNPVGLSQTPLDTYMAPPALGQHTHETLGGLLGYNADEIRTLEDAGAI
jgi:crotonobetainyl-CoA:carnitine CoA-transferase CaiB-like acyl-CoA transferase